MISFAEPQRLIHYQEHHKWPFILLADPERMAYQRFALKRLSWFHVFSPSTLWLYFKLWREGKKSENYGRDDYFQGGGDFLLDASGEMVFSHPSREPADRPTSQTLLREIDRFVVSRLGNFTQFGSGKGEV